jgi:chromatin remodeling complex protein RSC6
MSANDAKVMKRKSKKVKTEESSPAQVSEPMVETTVEQTEVSAPEATKKKVSRKRPAPSESEAQDSEPERRDTEGVSETEAVETTTTGPQKKVPEFSLKDLQERRDANARRRKEIRVEITRMLNEVRDLDKSDYQIESSLLRELKKKRKRVISEKTLEALSAPRELAPKFCEFLGVPEGTKMPRSEAKDSVHKYVIAQNLRLDKDKRFFYLDDKLRNLFDNPTNITLKPEELTKLNIENTDNLLGYFYMQKYINRLFLKTEPESEETAGVAMELGA